MSLKYGSARSIGTNCLRRESLPCSSDDSRRAQNRAEMTGKRFYAQITTSMAGTKHLDIVLLPKIGRRRQIDGVYLAEAHPIEKASFRRDRRRFQCIISHRLF